MRPASGAHDGDAPSDQRPEAPPPGDQEARPTHRAAPPPHRRRFGLVLLALVGVFVVEGVAEPQPWQQVLASFLLGLTLLGALRVGAVNPRITRVVAGLAALLVLLSIVEALTGSVASMSVRLANLMLVALAPPALALGTVRTLRTRNQVTIEVVFGALCLYLLIGLFFAFLYAWLGRIDGPFFSQDVAGTTPQYVYFSFTTLTTVGYGDLTAASNLGHTLSMSEALMGQIYLVTIVSVVVGNLGRRRSMSP